MIIAFIIALYLQTVFFFLLYLLNYMYILGEQKEKTKSYGGNYFWMESSNGSTI